MYMNQGTAYTSGNPYHTDVLFKFRVGKRSRLARPRVSTHHQPTIQLVFILTTIYRLVIYKLSDSLPFGRMMSLAISARFLSAKKSVPIMIGSLRKASNSCGMDFSYSNQGAWPGICVRGNDNLQSPINIISKDVKVDSSLKQLNFSPSWLKGISGTLRNTGRSVQFVPSTNEEAVTVQHHRGIYQLLQFHFHWGPAQGTGSEHTVDNVQADAELHFVLVNKDVKDETRRDYLSVVGVLLNTQESAANSDPWAKMDIVAIQNNASDPVGVNGLVLGSMLPEGAGYYHYQGSLTTPPCSETVQWFVMKEKLMVPSLFLQSLRMIQEEMGQPLQHNFRDLQPIGDRVVSSPQNS